MNTIEVTDSEFEMILLYRFVQDLFYQHCEAEDCREIEKLLMENEKENAN